VTSIEYNIKGTENKKIIANKKLLLSSVVGKNAGSLSTWYIIAELNTIAVVGVL
jgi:hypothetical protein